MEIIVVTSEDFSKIVEKTIRKAIKELHKEKPQSLGSEILTISQAAEFLNLAKQTLYGLTSRREIPHFKTGKKLYFRKSELLEWIESGRKRTQDQIAEDVESTLIKKGGKR